MSKDLLENAIAEHQAGNLSRAKYLYQQVRASNPNSDAALNGLGVLFIQTGQPARAVALLESAILRQSSNGSYHYHLAEARVALGESKAAIEHYLKAIALQPKEADYYFALGNAQTEIGKASHAIKSFETALLYAPYDAEIHNNLANNLADTGQLDQASIHLEKALQLEPGYVEVYFNLSSIKFERGELQSAIELCERAVKIAPDFIQAHLSLGRWYQNSPNRLADALLSFETVLKLRPEMTAAKLGLANTLLKLDEPNAALPLYEQTLKTDPDPLAHLGMSHCLIRLHQFKQAEIEARAAIRLSPNLAEAYLNLGVCLQTQGDFKQAIKAHRNALSLQPQLSDAAYHLAVLDRSLDPKTAFKTSIHLLKDNNLPLEKQYHLHFALGKLHEKQADHVNAFEQYQQANALKAQCYPFAIKRHQVYIERIIKMFTPAFFERRTGYGNETQSPVFIVGMPRSGSTLVEQILNQHASIRGIGEHREMREIMKQLPRLLRSETVIPEVIASLSKEESKKLAEQYLASLPAVGPNIHRVADKMLGNFLRLGLITLLFPNARIIHCRRNPIDTCLSCHTQDFAAGLRFTTDLRHLGLAYRTYVRLMKHWENVLPLKMITIDYEKLVCVPQQQTQTLIEFCGLPWDPACLEHHKANNQVATASFVQVRQPIYNKSVGKWRNYEKQLKPLIESLGSLVDKCI